jgi:hypothetical protein
MLAYARHGAVSMPDADVARGGLQGLNKIGNWNAHGTQGYSPPTISSRFLHSEAPNRTIQGN